MQNPKTTVAGYVTAGATFLGLLAQILPGRWSQYAMLAAVGVGGAAAALGNIQSQDGSH